MRRKRRRVIDEIPLASLPDLAFLLLIFFITSSIFAVEHGLPLVLPSAKRSPRLSVEPHQVFRIRGLADGTITVDDNPTPLQDVTPMLRGRNDALTAAGQAELHVEAYRKPQVAIRVAPARADYLTGEEVTAEVQVATYYGGAVQEAPLEWAVYRRPAEFDADAHRGFAWFLRREAPSAQLDWEPVARGEATTDAEGRATLAFATEALLGADTPEGRDRVRHGSAVITHMTKGAGEVFCAGTTEWCHGLAVGHHQTEIITRTVLDRFLAER